MVPRMNETNRLWIAAGIALAQDKESKVPCPACGSEFLSVEDALRPKDRGFVDRYLRCSSCQAFQVLTRVRV